MLVPQNGWFIMENPIEKDDFGAPLWRKPPLFRAFVGLHGKKHKI